MWPFKPVKFHTTPAWTKLARRHKAIEIEAGNYKCVDCGTIVLLQSDHVLSRKWYPELSLKLWNLVLRCLYCNLEKGTKIYWDRHTVRVLFRAVRNRAVIATLVATLGYCVVAPF